MTQACKNGSQQERTLDKKVGLTKRKEREGKSYQHLTEKKKKKTKDNYLSVFEANEGINRKPLFTRVVSEELESSLWIQKKKKNSSDEYSYQWAISPVKGS